MSRDEESWRETDFQGYIPQSEFWDEAIGEIRECEILKIIPEHLAEAAKRASVNIEKVPQDNRQYLWEFKVDGDVKHSGWVEGFKAAIDAADKAYGEWLDSQ